MNITKNVLEDLFKKDISVDQLCKELNISKGKFKRLCIQYSLNKPHKIKKSFPKHFNKTSFITLNWLKEQYIDKNLTIDEISQEYQISEKTIKKYLKEYQLTKSYKKFLIKKEIKRKNTCLEKYGVENVIQNNLIREKAINSIRKAYSSTIPIEKRRETCMKKYNVEHPFKLEEFKNKRYQTMIKNNSFCCGISKAEEQAYQLFLTKFPVEDIERQYKSELYPFRCDFYIKSLDLYIEYNGGQYHYKEPFDKNNPKHIERFNKLKQRELETKTKQKTVYSSMIRTWTESDPLKRETAKKNSLNFLEFWSIKEVKNWLDQLN